MSGTLYYISSNPGKQTGTSRNLVLVPLAFPEHWSECHVGGVIPSTNKADYMEEQHFEWCEDSPTW